MSSDPFWTDFFTADWCENAVLKKAGSAANAAGTSVKTLSTEAAACDLQEHGQERAGRVFILPPVCAAAPGDRIVYKNRNYDLKSVRTCVNAHGEVLALRAVSF